MLSGKKHITKTIFLLIIAMLNIKLHCDEDCNTRKSKYVKEYLFRPTTKIHKEKFNIINIIDRDYNRKKDKSKYKAENIIDKKYNYNAWFDYRIIDANLNYALHEKAQDKDCCRYNIFEIIDKSNNNKKEIIVIRTGTYIYNPKNPTSTHPAANSQIKFSSIDHSKDSLDMIKFEDQIVCLSNRMFYEYKGKFIGEKNNNVKLPIFYVYK
jgi:hypothetical protein